MAQMPRASAAAACAAAWHGAQQPRQGAPDEVDQRIAVVGAGLRLQQTLAQEAGLPAMTPLKTAIQALRALNQACGVAKHEGDGEETSGGGTSPISQHGTVHTAGFWLPGRRGVGALARTRGTGITAAHD